MSIESSVTHGASKTAASGATGHGHGKAQGATGAAGGFAALLLSLGADELPQEMEMLSDGGDARAQAPESASALPEQPADVVEPVLAGVLAAVGLPHVFTPLPAADAGTRLGSESVPQAVATGMAAKGSIGVEALAVAGRAPTRQAEAAVLAVDDDRSLVPAGQLRAVDAAGRQDGAAGLQPLLQQAALAQRATAQHRSLAVDMAAQAAKERDGQDAAARLGWNLVEQRSEAGAQTSMVLAVGAGEAGLRPLERRAEKASHRGGNAEPAAWSGPAMPDSVRPDVPAAAPDAGLMTEMRVAEQVSVWVARGVQNAELELDGLGEGAVSVNIALQGQEARVEFRADQVQTRQVLEDSMPHLRELLAREGLVLAGVSVGASGSDGAAGRPAQQGPKVERRSVAVVPELPAVTAGTAGRTGGVSGRSVDLFV